MRYALLNPSQSVLAAAEPPPKFRQTVPRTSRSAVAIRWLILLVCLLTISDSGALASEDGLSDALAAPSSLVERELKHAETYYWFGMAEQGNLAAFNRGYRHLDKANSLTQDELISPQQRAQYRLRIDALRTDLDEQVEIAHDTLYGVFPLFRFIGPSLFAESTSAGTFEVLDDPSVMATTSATKKLALEVIKNWSQRHHLDVVFASVPRNPQLENEALYLFNLSPKFFVHNYREVVDALTAAQLADFNAGRITPEVKDALLKSFQVSDLLVVLVHEIDVVDKDFFYIIEGRILNVRGNEPTHKFQVMGFSRDRNAQFYPMVITDAGLLLFAVFNFWLMTQFRLRAGVAASWTGTLVIPLLAFAVGRCMAWAVSPFLSSIAQIPETLAIASFWLPCLAGLVFLIVPMTVFWLASRRLAKFITLLNLEGRLAPAFVAIAAGAVGYLVVPSLLYLQTDGIAVLVPATIASLLVGHLLGRAWDRRDQLPAAFGLVPIALSLLLGAAWFHCSVWMTWTIAGLAIGIAAAALIPVLWRARRKVSQQGAGETIGQTAPTIAATPARADGSVLGERVERPNYCEFAAYEGASKMVAPAFEEKCVHLALLGSGGCGLSATAHAIIEDLARTLESKEQRVEKLCGECPPPTSEPTPFAPFRQALARHFETDLLASRESKEKRIDSALGAVFGAVVPFSDVLLPGSMEVGSASFSSSQELFRSIAMVLRRLAKRNAVVLFIDDAQWLDNSSKLLLSHLLSAFPSGSEESVTIIVASRSRQALVGLGGDLAGTTVEVPFPSLTEQVEILTRGIGLSHATAKQIVDRLGTSTQAHGGLFWLLQVVSNLARSGVLVQTDEGLAMPGNRWPEDVEVPDEMRDVLRARLSKLPQYRNLLLAAACACDGREFSATLVARALDKPRLEVLTDLDYLDRETSILFDVLDRPDIFAFQSSFLLEVVREELRVTEQGPAARVPEIVREYHSRLAEILAQSLRVDGGLLYRVANHYYAAGGPHADTAMRYCVEAANAAAAVLDFETASGYLQRAEDCAQFVGRPDAVESERLYIACRKASLGGTPKEQSHIARLARKHLQGHESAPTPLMFVTAQLHYELGNTTGDRAWLDTSLKIGQQIVSRSQTQREKAIGRLLVGASLRPDDPERREHVLRPALKFMEPPTEQEVVDPELLGRLISRLAEELSRGTLGDLAVAKQLHEVRLAFNERNSLSDRQGEVFTHLALGRIMLNGERSDLPAAYEHFQRALDASESIGYLRGQIHARTLLGDYALQKDDLDTGHAHYRRAWKQADDPLGQFIAGTGLYRYYVRAGETERLQRVVVRLLALAGEHKLPPECANSIANELGHCSPETVTEEAESLYGTVLEIEERVFGPDHPHTVVVLSTLAQLYSNRAWSLATCADPQQRDASRAVALAEKAVAMRPNGPNDRNVLGVAYFRAGDWAKVVATLQNGDQMLSGSHGFFLAMAYWQLGNEDEARRWFEKSMEWIEQHDPDEEVLRFRDEAAEMFGIEPAAEGSE